MTRRSWRRAVAALIASMLLVGGFPAAAGAQMTVAFRITDGRITEMSGMARSPQAGLYWVVNDSGSGGVVYGVTGKGKVQGTLRYRAAPVDVEAVALHQDRLYVADIGDNANKRRTVAVYAFDRPRASGLTVSYRQWDFRYPDGPHDAETLLVTPDGRLNIVTKAAEGSIYRAPKTLSATRTNTLVKVGPAPAYVTDGLVLPGGRQLALLTYRQVLVVDAKTGIQQASAPVTGQKQAESLALSLSGRSLLVGSEGTKPNVLRLAIPAAPTAAPPPSAADPGNAEDPDDPGPTAAPNRRGTALAVGLAGLVAIVAGVVTGVVRRR